MKRIGIIGTAALSSLLLLGITVPAYSQEEKRGDEAKPAPEEQQHTQEGKPAQKKAQQPKMAPEKNQHAQEAKPQQDQHAQQGKPSAQKEQHAQQAKPAPQKNQHAQQQRSQPAQHANGGRIPDDRYRANFGREHTFRVSQNDYSSRRFQYGGYSFGFVDPWPSNWLYTQSVFVVYINGVYYLCNPAYPGVNVALNIAL